MSTNEEDSPLFPLLIKNFATHVTGGGGHISVSTHTEAHGPRSGKYHRTKTTQRIHAHPSLCYFFFLPSRRKCTVEATKKLNERNKNSNTYCRWGGPSGMCHWVTGVLHGIADEIGSSRAADELSSRDAHLNPTSAHHAVGRNHGGHLRGTPLGIKVIPSSVLAVHLRFCVRISCCSALEEEGKRKQFSSLYHPHFFSSVNLCLQSIS